MGHHVHPRVLGLGEVMDYVNVLGASQEIFKKLELFHGKVIDEHSPSLTGQQLQAYALASITPTMKAPHMNKQLKERGLE